MMIRERSIFLYPHLPLNNNKAESLCVQGTRPGCVLVVHFAMVIFVGGDRLGAQGRSPRSWMVYPRCRLGVDIIHIMMLVALNVAHKPQSYDWSLPSTSRIPTGPDCNSRSQFRVTSRLTCFNPSNLFSMPSRLRLRLFI